jgi:hypothetical protein
MTSTTEFLRRLRGETSGPLIAELGRLIAKGILDKQSLVGIQVKSDLVSRGLSLIFHHASEPTAWIYISRKEIPGYLPNSAKALLTTQGWSIANDIYGEEFAVAWKQFPSDDQTLVTTDIAHALEALGAPQRSKWHLEATYP